MSELNKEQFGQFVAQLRKEQGLTQRELADKLFLSDKAVSKWERGLSLPDVGLLQPLAELLGVTLAELLQGHRQEGELSTGELDALLAGAVELSAEKEKDRRSARTARRRAYVLSALVCLGEIGLLLGMGIPAAELGKSVLLVAGLCFLFGAWLCFGAREELPAYYDQNKISFYGDGVFRMNLAGLRLNNSNWPHILNTMRIWLLGTACLFPVLWLAGRSLVAQWQGEGEMALTLIAMLGLFVPTYVVGKRYQ